MSLLRFTALAIPALLVLQIHTASSAPPKRQPPPTRSFDGPGAPPFVRLDAKPGLNPPLDVDGSS